MNILLSVLCLFVLFLSVLFVMCILVFVCRGFVLCFIWWFWLVFVLNKQYYFVLCLYQSCVALCASRHARRCCCVCLGVVCVVWLVMF